MKKRTEDGIFDDRLWLVLVSTTLILGVVWIFGA